MLLLSSLVNFQQMSKSDFVRLLIQWNQDSPHKDNIILNMQWDEQNPRYDVRFGTSDLYMTFKEYADKNILAARYRNKDSNGMVWHTDFVANFDEMKLAIHLDRSFQKDTQSSDKTYSTPQFLSLLIREGYAADDGELPVLDRPFYITKDNIGLLAGIINGEIQHQIPVIYISKTQDGYDPVDIWRLSYGLKGLAHVLVEEGVNLNYKIREMCGSRNPYFGSISIYFPNRTFQSRTFHYREGKETWMMEKITRSVINYGNAINSGTLYTWQGVTNAILRDNLDRKSNELQTLKTEKNTLEEESCQLIDSLDDDIRGLEKQVEELSRINESYSFENQGLRAKLENMENVPVLIQGGEYEFYPGEITSIILDALEAALPQYEEGSRRHVIIRDILEHNEKSHQAEKMSEQLKNILKGYKCLSGAMKRDLMDLGLSISEDSGRHYKVTYHDDPRFTATLAKTPSDNRSGINVAKQIINTCF